MYRRAALQEPTTRFVTGRVSHQWEDEARRAAVAARLRTEKDALDRRGGTGSGSGKDSGGDSGSDSGSGGGRFSGGAGEAKAADDGDDDHDDHDEEIDGGGVFSSGGGIDGWAAPPLSSAGVQRPGCGTVGPPPGQPWAKRAVASGALGEPAPYVGRCVEHCVGRYVGHLQTPRERELSIACNDKRAVALINLCTLSRDCAGMRLLLTHVLTSATLRYTTTCLLCCRRCNDR